jgi:hypothetical protein
MTVPVSGSLYISIYPRFFFWLCIPFLFFKKITLLKRALHTSIDRLMKKTNTNDKSAVLEVIKDLTCLKEEKIKALMCK